MELHTVFYNNKPTPLYIHSESDTISNYIRKWNCFYEHWFLDYVYKTYKEQNIIVDVGANIGNHSLFFATHLNYKHIHAFEPFPKNINLAIKNLSTYRERVTLHSYALSNNADSVQLYNFTTQNRIIMVDTVWNNCVMAEVFQLWMQSQREHLIPTVLKT